jgi:hypothetical protein
MLSGGYYCGHRRLLKGWVFTPTAFACCAGVKDGGPPPGRYLLQACLAAWNCGELGSTFPLITTPAMLS